MDATVLARELEVSARTIKRDIERLRNIHGAPVVWEPSTRTYFYDGPCDVLPLLRLSADEALALELAGHTFAAWRGSPLGRALASAFGKIKAVVGGAVSVPVNEISAFISQPDQGPTAELEHRFFSEALQAIQSRREILLDYLKPGAKRAERRKVHPLHLAYLDHGWMLIAYDLARKGFRNFLLTRIRSAELTGIRFPPSKDFDVQVYLAGSLGRFTGRNVYEVRIHFDSFAAPYIRESRWHPSQIIEDHERDGSLELALHLNHLIDVQRWILSWGSHAEALAPAELRRSISGEIASLSARYRPTAQDSSPLGHPVSLPVS